MFYVVSLHRGSSCINTLRLGQNGHRFPDDIFKCTFQKENVLNLNRISLKFVPKGQINDIPALVQTMAWHRLGDKPLSEPMMVSLLTHICVTRLFHAIWQHTTGSTLSQVMAWFLMTPSHYLNSVHL